MISEKNGKIMDSLMENEEFLQQFEKANSMDSLYALFVENGVDFSQEELQASVDEMHRRMEENGLISASGELSPEMLDLVSGGGWARRICKAAFAGSVAALAFTVGMPGAGVLLCIACVGSLQGY